MSFQKQVWDKLSKVNVNEHTETKGSGNYQLTYLSWSWAWATLMEHYPESEFVFHSEQWGDDRTCTVSCTVTLRDGESAFPRFMWLPVMDHKNLSVQSPTSRQISDARMRCLTKCLALFGLGHYLYAGEDIPCAEKDAASSKTANPAKPVLTPDQHDLWGRAKASFITEGNLKKVLARVDMSPEHQAQLQAEARLEKENAVAGTAYA